MRITITAIVLTLLFNSCCSKKNCTIETGNVVTLHGFSAADVDTVIVKASIRGSLETYVTDSTTYVATPTNEPGVYSIPYSGFVETRDYSIELVSIDRKYIIDNIATEKKSCGSCDKERTVYEHLATYHKDGSLIQSSKIELKK